jgi:hypothetical protein
VIYAIFRFEKPETSVSSLRLIGVDEQHKTFSIGLNVQVFNPNNLKVEVLRIEGNILIDGTIVAPLYNDTGMEVPPKGSSDIELVIVVDDRSMNVLKGDVLTIRGSVHGKYLWVEGSSDFDESMDLPGHGTGPGNIPPIAVIEAPLTAVVLEDVSFSGALSVDRDGEITNYNWDMGDGTTLEGEIVQHRYRVPGLYIVELEVTDDRGETDIARHEITIRTRL